MIIPQDMPKLQSPFIREGEHFLVTPQINPGCRGPIPEWVNAP